jgi:DNA-binding NarL/FixJ family response regulator
MDGFQVLSWIRHHHQFPALPVILLGSSTQIRDVNRACFLGANSYYVKEGDFEQIVAQSSILQKYWAANNTPPRTSLPSHNLRNFVWETVRAFVATK